MCRAWPTRTLFRSEGQEASVAAAEGGGERRRRKVGGEGRGSLWEVLPAAVRICL